MMSLKFEAAKSLNVGGMKMIPVKTNEDKPVFLKTAFVWCEKRQEI